MARLLHGSALASTLELYRAGYFPAVIASGGIGTEGYDEASVMRDFDAAKELNPSDISARGTTTTINELIRSH